LVSFFDIDPPFNSATNPLARNSANLVSWKLGLNFKPSDDLLLYATVNRGIKAGGYNAPSVPVTGVVPFVFRPEKLMAYEAGFKSTFGDNRTTLNGSVYYYDYKDYQAYRSLGFTNFIFNADARTYGAELQLSTHPAEGLNLMLGAAYTNNEVKDVALAPGVVRNRVAAFAPRFEGTALIRYETPVGIGKLGFQLDGAYTSSYFVQITNTGVTRNSSRVLLNGRITLAANGDAGWQVNAGVKNITDEHYLVAGFDTSDNFGSSTVTFNMPRTWDIGFNFKF
jgi:iron complex outermembrane receptor protein